MLWTNLTYARTNLYKFMQPTNDLFGQVQIVSDEHRMTFWVFHLLDVNFQMFKYKNIWFCIDGGVVFQYLFVSEWVSERVCLWFLVLTESALNIFVAVLVLVSLCALYLLQHSVVHLKSISLGMNTNESRRTDKIFVLFFHFKKRRGNKQRSKLQPKWKTCCLFFYSLMLFVVYIHLRFLME